MVSAAKSKNAVEIFSYIARDQKSSVVKGEIKAIEERIVLEQLQKNGGWTQYQLQLKRCPSLKSLM